ncbi:MAG: P-II family nitrogen regulator [Bacillota bacterium]
MKKIECIIRPEKLDPLKEALGRLDIRGMTVSQVLGHGLQQGRKGVYRGQEYTINLLPKVKVEIVIADRWLDDVIRIISQVCATGEIGDGKIFVYSVENAIRIRTGETGEDAL